MSKHCNFAVGENTGSRLGELKPLDSLSGQLKISRLENLRDVGDAEAELSSKGNLNVLVLEWGSYSGNSDIETRVLDLLIPHKNLEELTVRGYGGATFPI